MTTVRTTLPPMERVRRRWQPSPRWGGKCSCHNGRGILSECDECRRTRLSCIEESVSQGISGTLAPQFGHSFERIGVLPGGPTSAKNVSQANSPDDDELDDPEAIQSVDAGTDMLSEAPLTNSGPNPSSDSVALDQPVSPPGAGVTAPACPSKTVVENTQDATPGGLAKGYRTGYGIVANMRVEPTSQNWDGTSISESLQETKNTCPAEFKISPCSGGPAFTVGNGSHSGVFGDLPGTKNHFHDHHMTRWSQGSLLHDRNPKNIDSCQIVCAQQYSCGDTVIGKHTVTRTFSKATHNGHDVTKVDITKT